MLLEALNSSGQYALSSGIINADLVALGAGRPRVGGAALRSAKNGQPAVCVCTKEPGKASSGRHWGQEGSQLVLSELFKVNRGSRADGTLLLVVTLTRYEPWKEFDIFSSLVALRERKRDRNRATVCNLLFFRT